MAVTERDFIDAFLQSNKLFEKFASRYGIHDIYQDGNIKQLQQSIYLGLSFNSGRTSFDATDADGNPWELKSLNVLNRNKTFTTCSLITDAVLDRYEQCYWAFSLYKNTTLISIFVMHPHQLSEYFNEWRNKIRNAVRLNNPKIPLSFVKRYGYEIYNAAQSSEVINPIIAVRELIKREEQFSLAKK